MKPQVPEILPFVRICDPLCNPVQLFVNTPICVTVPFTFDLRSRKAILDLRIVFADSLEGYDNQSIHVSCTNHEGVAKSLTATPTWAKSKGIVFNRAPINITDLGHFVYNERKHSSEEVTLRFGIRFLLASSFPGRVKAIIYKSRKVSASILQRSILATPQFTDKEIKQAQATLVDSGIDSYMVSLKCPLTGIRIKDPVRCETCRHLQCFDLASFVSMEMRRPKGRCPLCNELIEVRRMAVCQSTKAMLAAHPDCDMYAVTADSVRPISNDEKEKCTQSRKRKRKTAVEIDSDTESIAPSLPKQAKARTRPKTENDHDNSSF